MIPGTTVVTLDSKWSGLMLHSKIGPNGSRTVTNEVVRGREPFGFQQDMEKVVEGFLRKRRSQRLMNIRGGYVL